jgi:hypothetical protein
MRGIFFVYRMAWVSGGCARRSLPEMLLVFVSVANAVVLKNAETRGLQTKTLFLITVVFVSVVGLCAMK